MDGLMCKVKLFLPVVSNGNVQNENEWNVVTTVTPMNDMSIIVISNTNPEGVPLSPEEVLNLNRNEIGRHIQQYIYGRHIPHLYWGTTVLLHVESDVVLVNRYGQTCETTPHTKSGIKIRGLSGSRTINSVIDDVIAQWRNIRIHGDINDGRLERMEERKYEGERKSEIEAEEAKEAKEHADRVERGNYRMSREQYRKKRNIVMENKEQELKEDEGELFEGGSDTFWAFWKTMSVSISFQLLAGNHSPNGIVMKGDRGFRYVYYSNGSHTESINGHADYVPPELIEEGDILYTGASFMGKTPKFFNQKSIVNPYNIGLECFKDAICCAYYKDIKNPHKKKWSSINPKTGKSYYDLFCWDGITFPPTHDMYDIFYKNNPHFNLRIYLNGYG